MPSSKAEKKEQPLPKCEEESVFSIPNQTAMDYKSLAMAKSLALEGISDTENPLVLDSL